MAWVSNAQSAAAGSLTGATLAANITASSLTSFGENASLTNPTFTTPTLGTITSGDLSAGTGKATIGGIYSADSTTTSNTIGDCTGFSFAVAANSNYIYSFLLNCNCSSTGGIKFAINGPSGATLRAFGLGNNTSIGGYVANTITALNTLWSSTVINANFDGEVRIIGFMTTSVTSGTLQLRFASGTNGQTSTVYKGSQFSYQKV